MLRARTRSSWSAYSERFAWPRAPGGYATHLLANLKVRLRVWRTVCQSTFHDISCLSVSQFLSPNWTRRHTWNQPWPWQIGRGTCGCDCHVKVLHQTVLHQLLVCNLIRLFRIDPNKYYIVSLWIIGLSMQVCLMCTQSAIKLWSCWHVNLLTYEFMDRWSYSGSKLLAYSFPINWLTHFLCFATCGFICQRD